MSAPGPSARPPGGVGAAEGCPAGSALILALFVMALLSGTGIVLLFVSETEMKTSKVDHRAKQAFFVAEAGLEHGRETLRVVNLSDLSSADRLTFDDELSAAAGANGVIDLDPAALRPVYATDGTVVGFTGSGDDLPLRSMTAFGDQRYAAFLTNDPIDGRANPVDSNDRVMITAIGTGPSGAVEVVQAIVERYAFPALPATITIIGPTASFDGGKSAAKDYTGDDCAGGIPGLSVPVVGVIGSASEVSAEAGVHKPSSYTSGGATGVDTVSDVEGTIDPSWKDCAYLRDLARRVRAAADVVGSQATDNSLLGTPADPRIVFIDGDYSVGGGFSGAGVLWVTGRLTFSGNAGWSGVIFTVGKGDFRRNGGGNGGILGANFVANISGPDGLLWTADDCSGPDGIPGTGDDGAAVGTYNNAGGGTGLTGYCSTAIADAQTEFPFPLASFRQR